MNFIEWLKVIVLGIVEGITEWLPISSTGHLILTDAIWPLQQSDAFKEMFNVVIQLGAILAVVVLYWSKLWPFHRKRIPQRSWFAQQSTNGFVGGQQRYGDRYCCMDKIVMWLKIAVSCLPAMLIGLPLNDWLDKHFYNPTVVALMLLLYGAGFLFVERYNRSRKPRVNSIASLRWSDALLIGVFQVLALIPGTSRSGATILGGILIGTSREVAAEYTFFLAVPVMFGASLLKIGAWRAARRHGGRLRRVHPRHSLPHGLYPQARFHGIWLVSHRPRPSRAAVLLCDPLTSSGTASQREAVPVFICT